MELSATKKKSKGLSLVVEWQRPANWSRLKPSAKAWKAQRAARSI
jgi:hypothetical protein